MKILLAGDNFVRNDLLEHERHAAGNLPDHLAEQHHPLVRHAERVDGNLASHSDHQSLDVKWHLSGAPGRSRRDSSDLGNDQERRSRQRPD